MILLYPDLIQSESNLTYMDVRYDKVISGSNFQNWLLIELDLNAYMFDLNLTGCHSSMWPIDDKNRCNIFKTK